MHIERQRKRAATRPRARSAERAVIRRAPAALTPCLPLALPHSLPPPRSLPLPASLFPWTVHAHGWASAECAHKLPSVPSRPPHRPTFCYFRNDAHARSIIRPDSLQKTIRHTLPVRGWYCELDARRRFSLSCAGAVGMKMKVRRLLACTR